MSTLRYPIPGGVTRLSELEIDTDKDWQGHHLWNLTLDNVVSMPSEEVTNIDSSWSYSTKGITSGSYVSALSDYLKVYLEAVAGGWARVSYNISGHISEYADLVSIGISNFSYHELGIGGFGLITTQWSDNSSVLGVGTRVELYYNYFAIQGYKNGGFHTLATHGLVGTYKDWTLEVNIVTKKASLLVNGVRYISDVDVSEYLPSSPSQLAYLEFINRYASSTVREYYYYFPFKLKSSITSIVSGER